MRHTKETITERFRTLFPSSNFEVLEWNGIKNYCKIKCLDCGKILEYSEADKIVDRSRRGLQLICRYCEDTAQKKPREVALSKIQNILNKKKTIILLEEPKRLRVKAKWYCLKCNHDFERTLSDFLKNSKCPWCEGIFQKFSINEIKIKAFDLYGNEYTILDNDYDYKKSEKILVRHEKCGFIFNTNVHNFLRGHSCPRCKSSLGELKVRNFLIKHNIYFLEQYSFSDSEISSLKFDFYIENKKEKFVIEYNGRQHYEPVDYFGGKKAFLKQKERDNKKKEYCLKNNIDFIEIPYYEESLLSKELAQRLGGQVLED